MMYDDKVKLNFVPPKLIGKPYRPTMTHYPTNRQPKNIQQITAAKAHTNNSTQTHTNQSIMYFSTSYPMATRKSSPHPIKITINIQIELESPAPNNRYFIEFTH